MCFRKSYICSKKVGCASCFFTVQQNLRFFFLDTGLRLDDLPALELWDIIVFVVGNISRVSDRSGQLGNDDHKTKSM